MIRRFSRVALLTLSLAGLALPVVAHAATGESGTSASSAPVPAAFTPHACWMPLSSDVRDSVQCGYVTVPLHHDKPANATIKLAVAVLAPTGSQPAADPVVVLSGGPSQSGVNLLTTFLDGIPDGLLAARASRPIVFVDQRGSGYGEPQLSCPEMSEEGDIKVQTRACYDRLSATNDLSAYTTENNAKDFDYVRRALGYRQWNLYGVSYGSKLGYNILRYAPRGTIRSAILSSPVPHQPNWITSSPQAVQSGLDALYAACRNDDPCRRSYGNLRTKTEEIYRKLADTPLQVKLTIGGQTTDLTVDRDAFIQMLEGFLYPKAREQVLPELIDALYDRDPQRVANVLVPPSAQTSTASQTDTAAEPTRDPEANDGMYFSIMCAEELTAGTDADLRASSDKVSDVAAGVAPFRRMLMGACQYWPVPKATGPWNEAHHSKVPTLIVAGAFDPATPPAYGRIMAASLPRAQLVTIAAAGHSPLEWAGSCASHLVSTFYANPGHRVDARCAAAAMTFTIGTAPDSATATESTTLDNAIPMLASPEHHAPTRWRRTTF